MPIDFFRPLTDAASSSRNRDLLQGGASPVVPRGSRLPFVQPHVAEQWLDGMRSRDYAAATSRLLTSCSVTNLWTHAQIGATLQHAAATLLSVGQKQLAHRCLQEAVAQLANGGPAVSAEFDLQRWILLSAVSFASKDVEAARLWLRQASGTLTGHASDLSNQASSHFLGDLLSLQACLLWDAGDSISALGTFREAIKHHREAASPASVAADLILTSRVQQSDSGKLDHVRKQLSDAIDILNRWSSAEQPLVCEHLRELATSDLASIKTHFTPQTTAAWN